MANADLIERLTEREKECLRLWLQHKTAKEIALDLGVSHHAVEKRLKMARIKLDVSTSLEAARLLAQHEGYDPSVAQSPELSSTPRPLEMWKPQFIAFGVFAMFLIALSALALAPSTQVQRQDDNEAKWVEIESGRNLDKVFETLDGDGSGYLENPESPFVTVAFLDEDGAGQTEGKATLGDSKNEGQIAQFYAEADTDGDNRVSFAEYYAWSETRWAELGIEIKSIIKVRAAPKS